MNELRGTLSAAGGLTGALRGSGALTGRLGGAGLKVVEGELMVDTANAVEQDNTRPVTSAAVYVEIGNIEALLAAL